MEKLIEEILEELKTELSLKEKPTEIELLQGKIKNALREVRSRRHYPAHWTEAMILFDLEHFYASMIREVALYDFNQLGAEGQELHIENSVNRRWKSREDCFIGLVSFAKSV